MWSCRSQCSRFKKQPPPPRCPFTSTVALLWPREGSFVVRTNRHDCARFLLASWGLGRRVVGRSKVPTNRFPLEKPELDVDMSNWLNFRSLDFVPVSGGDTISQVCGWPSRRRCRCFFDRSRTRDTLARRARERTHYHIVTTFEAGHLVGWRKVLAFPGGWGGYGLMYHYLKKTRLSISTDRCIAIRILKKKSALYENTLSPSHYLLFLPGAY
jgi:hypothetical protein